MTLGKPATANRRPDLLVGNVPEGMQALAIARLLERQGNTQTRTQTRTSGAGLVFVARDGARMVRVAEQLASLASAHDIVTFPAWDCLPYDRVSPNGAVIAERLTTLARLRAEPGLVVVTSVNAVSQKLLPVEVADGFCFAAQAGAMLDGQRLIKWADANGYLRVPTVREAGEYAVRGGLIDLFAAGANAPLRFDFFGQALETIRTFDPATQRTTGQMPKVSLVPMSEVVLTPQTIKSFRSAYTTAHGGATADDPLYGAISAGQRYAGMEHWLAYFYGELANLTDFTGPAPFVFDDQAGGALAERQAQIADYFSARTEALAEGAGGGAPYKPSDPGRLYRLNEGLGELADANPFIQFSAFSPTKSSADKIEDFGGAVVSGFAAERAAPEGNVFEAVLARINQKQNEGKSAIIACWSLGSRDRMAQVVGDHAPGLARQLDNWNQISSLGKREIGLIVLGLETGFQTATEFVLSEQDILGERLIRKTSKARGAEALTEASSLGAGDLVVHVDHGIGRFIGLRAIEVTGAPHDCVELAYANDAKLYLPVENIELLSRYGSGGDATQLDRLGGVGWQTRKARLKKRIREIADQLIKIAAARELIKADVIGPPAGAYDEFCARFPYEETEDQLTAIEAVFDDLASGKVMDRLICGDVGFGKTEVALRAAFAVALSGRQVAIVVPTTLLARQHFKTFTDRFANFPVRISHLSRLVSAKGVKLAKKEIAEGQVDIAIGTHALLAKSVEFADLGLLVIDEEQHFGVAHKERLKEIKANIHVLTLTATPIPRTLQLALTGVRDLSILATPPLDRLAVRSFVSPFDPLVVREALLREKYRGGQSFYVVPRIKDQPRIEEFLTNSVPEVRYMVANGQMAPGRLDDIMNAYYDAKFDVLLATTIVQSGLDIPAANTLIVHRADRFGLAQLHQIRGRIGRSKTRAYALFTTAADRQLTETAQRRLSILQSLESLGAGFELASHDLDLRGSGNLLGEEQSGQIREVGFELYQSMLEEAVVALRAGAGAAEEADGQWSPQIAMGIPVLIPEGYVPDLAVRMQLYRRLGDMADGRAIDGFGAEMIDRFGPLPDEVQSLLKTVLVKSLCVRANVEKVDAGPKGVVITLRNNTFPNPAGLVALLSNRAEAGRLKPDQKLVFARNWPDADDRLKGVGAILSRLAKLAEATL